MSNCQECGRDLSSWTTVNGRVVCEWCKPKPSAPTNPGNKPSMAGVPAKDAGAREFWIVRNPACNTHTLFLTKPEWKSITLGHERIDLIEKSAYEKLEREKNKYHDQWYSEAKRTQALEEKAVALVVALKQITKCKYHGDANTYAERALAKYKESK